jgi:hypothetical protein
MTMLRMVPGEGSQGKTLGAFLCALLVLAARPLFAVPIPDHVVIVIEENHSFDSIIGNANAPYMNSLAAGGTSLTNMFALTHPSQPNYLQFFSGSNQGVTDNTVPAPGSPFSSPNLGASLISAGASFTGYSEDLPSAGSTVSGSGDYVRRHNPWVNWQSNAPTSNQLAPSTNQPFSAFPTNFNNLPKVSIVVPNLQHDMHDGTIAQADAWLVSNIKPYADWAQTHNSLLVVTWDEDGSASRNRIPTILSGPMVASGVSSSTWTLHNLTRSVEDMYGASHSGSANDVRSMVGMFTGDPQVATRTFQQGRSGYTSAHDTYIEQVNPNTAHGGDTQVVADGSPLSQGLVRFDNLFGNGAGQVPVGATVVSAKLVALTGTAANDSTTNNMSLHAMKVAWTDTSTWNSLVAGITADDTEASAQSEFTLLPNQLDNYAVFDVTRTVQAWALDPTKNFGWLINPSGTDGWRWQSSDFGTLADRPYLEIVYVLPEPSTLMLLAAGVALVVAIRSRHRPTK